MIYACFVETARKAANAPAYAMRRACHPADRGKAKEIVEYLLLGRGRRLVLGGTPGRHGRAKFAAPQTFG